MTISKNYEEGEQTYSVSCNKCMDVIDMGPDMDFYEVKDAVDKDGWKTVKVGESWHHICPDCL